MPSARLDVFVGLQAVFSFYDVNKDGSISAEEFDGIATNFPFIDNFRVLDANRSVLRNSV